MQKKYIIQDLDSKFYFYKDWNECKEGWSEIVQDATLYDTTESAETAIQEHNLKYSTIIPIYI